MSIQNVTRKTIVASQIIEAESLLQKSFGLLLYKTPRPILFRTRFGIHTFFMRYAIDVVILDRNYSVVYLKKRLKPWRIFLWSPNYDLVLELPEGTIEKTKTRVTDIFLMT